MKNTSFIIAVPHLFLPKSAFRAESNLSTVALCFNVTRNVSNKSNLFPIFNNTFVAKKSMYYYKGKEAVS